jgi:hypothetical protein
MAAQSSKGVLHVAMPAVRAGGLNYLGLVTELLQRQRVTDMTAGL